MFCYNFQIGVFVTALDRPEALVEGMFVLVVPVLQVNAEAVFSLGGQLMYVVITQPEF